MFKAQVTPNYREHPAFSFGQPCLPLNAELVRSFNDSYEALNSFPGNLSRAQFDSLAGNCHTILNRIFEEMESAAADAEELLFLKDLRLECLTLLTTELSYHKTVARSPEPVLSSKLSVEGATSLKLQRHYFGRLPEDAVREIQALAAPDLARFRENARQGNTTRAALSINSGPVVRNIMRILNSVYSRQGVLEAVSAYAGCNMRVMGLSLELSVPQSGWWTNTFSELSRPPHTLYAHLDESIDHPKSIVYVSDVGTEHGPTCVYPGIYESLRLTPLQDLVSRIVGNVGQSETSPLHAYYARSYHQAMSSEKFRRHFMRLPDDLLFYSHFGWDVIPDSRLETDMTACATSMLGPAGTYVIFDGSRLVHRGGLITSGERVALQVVFSHDSLAQRLRVKAKNVARKILKGFKK